MSRLRHAALRAADALRCIREARRAHGIGLPQAIGRFAALYGPRQYSIAEIEALDLLDPRITRTDLDRRQSKQAQLEMQLQLNPRAHWPRVENKVEFERHCHVHGLPVPCSHGTFEIARTVARERPARRAVAALRLADASAQQLVVKPVDGLYGLGVYRLERKGGTFVCHDGRRRSPGDVYDWIEATSDFAHFLVQDRLFPHPDIVRLSGSSSLQTVRMVTYVTASGDVAIGNCQLRVIVGDSPIDNYRDGRTGNLICDVPLASGVVSRCSGNYERGRGFAEVERHPHTGVPFSGFRVPDWDAACRLVRNAATAFLPLRTIGWDVAITGRGPVLIEGNVTWDPAYEGEVGGEILRAVVADQRNGAQAAPRAPVPTPSGSAASG